MKRTLPQGVFHFCSLLLVRYTGTAIEMLAEEEPR
jgi:hypothetical protein